MVICIQTGVQMSGCVDPAGEASGGDVYDTLLTRMIAFTFKPGDRLNEGLIARELGVSRTPVREALNRLTADGFIDHKPGKGFSRRKLDAREVFDLYELRSRLETAAVLLGVARATPEALSAIAGILEESAALSSDGAVEDLVRVDEAFHEALMALTGNHAMLTTLRNINARIRFVRWIDMRGRRGGTQGEHAAILAAFQSGDAVTSSDLLERHIERRMGQIVDAVRECYAQLYVPDVTR